jgi:hypothetical protein
LRSIRPSTRALAGLPRKVARRRRSDRRTVPAEVRPAALRVRGGVEAQHRLPGGGQCARPSRGSSRVARSSVSAASAANRGR